MTLAWLVIVPFAAGVLAWIAGQWSRAWPRWIALAGIAIDLAIAVALWAYAGDAAGQRWMAELDLPWIDQLGIRIHLALDGLSLLLLLLTGFIGVIAVAASWTEIEERVGFFHFHLMWVLSGIAGVIYALQYNRAGTRQRLFSDKKDKALPSARAHGRLPKPGDRA